MSVNVKVMDGQVIHMTGDRRYALLRFLGRATIWRCGFDLDVERIQIQDGYRIRLDDQYNLFVEKDISA